MNKATILTTAQPQPAGDNGTKAIVSLSDNYSGEMYWHNTWGARPGVGQEIEYEQEMHPQYGPKVKVKKPGGSGKGGGFAAKNESIERQTALKAAVELSEKNSNPDQVIAKAEVFHRWIQNKPTVSTPQPGNNIPDQHLNAVTGGHQFS